MNYIPSFFLPKNEQNSLPPCMVVPYMHSEITTRSKVMMETHAISFILEGEKSVFLGEESITFDHGSFIVLRKGKCLMTERLSSSGVFKSILFFFDTTFLLDFYKKHQITIKKDISDKSFSIFKKNELLHSVSTSLLPYFQSNHSLTFAEAAIKTEELLLQIIRQYGSDSLHFLLQENPSIHEIAFQKMMEQHVGKNLTSSELAFLCHMSPSTFRRKFQRIYKQPPGKWFTQKKLEKAAQLLRYSNQQATEIYPEIGFESLSSFIQSFKKEFGMTPKQFQQKEMTI